jgi:hypothetical protein
MEVIKMKALIRKPALKYGMVFGLILLVLVLLSMIFGVGTPIVELLGSLFHGYTSTLAGGIIGFLWGLVAGYVVSILMDIADGFIHRH